MYVDLSRWNRPDPKDLQMAILTLIDYIAFHVSQTHPYTPQRNDITIITLSSFMSLEFEQVYVPLTMMILRFQLDSLK